MVVSTQTPTALRILVAEEKEVHKRLRGAVMSFLKPESLKSFVGRMESVIEKHFVDHWEGKESVTVLPLMKKRTFDVACTTFRKVSNARRRICKQLVGIIEGRKVEIAKGRASPEQDLLSCLVCMRDENGQPLTEEEVIDNLIVGMLAGHDTTSTLVTHLVRMLALHSEFYQNFLQGSFVGVVG
ncbi:cytochrome P450 716B2 [Cryptomeria japonica]|uniref:cytochrome P450 716B2 n=1 Tax=Cryptomeria japonica TaxID=3369 RepID=UPI0027D9E425|nr:cytochrome P450 716B2 [Cryptomeria japonica]